MIINVNASHDSDDSFAASSIDEWSETASVALRSNRTSSLFTLASTLVTCSNGRQQLKPPLTSALTDVLHEGWKKLGLTTKSQRFVTQYQCY